MSFLLNTIVEPNDVVDVLVAKLVGNTEYLVIAKLNSLEIHSFETNDQIKLQRKLDLYESVLDVKAITLFDGKVFLVIATDSNKILLVGFKSIQNEVVLEGFNLQENGSSLSIQPRTLTIEPSDAYFTFYTIEGLLVTYEVEQKVNTKVTFDTYLKQKKTKKTIFKIPTISSFPRSAREARSPMMVERMMSYNDGSEMYLKVLYRDDLFNYYLKTFVKQNPNLEVLNNLQLPEEIKPILISSKFGVFFFGKSGIYLQNAPYYNSASVLASQNQSENSTIEVENNNHERCYIKKSLPVGDTWEITGASLFENNDDSIVTIVFTTALNELYVSTFKGEQDTEKGCINISYWTIQKLKGQIGAAKSITQIGNDSFVFHSNTSISVVRINLQNKSFKMIHNSPFIPPILDFNISGTTIPKVQVCGGDRLDSGFIKTEFKGYDTKLSSFGGKLDIQAGILNVWHIDDNFIVNTLDGVQIYEVAFGGLREVDDFHGLKEVDGNVLAMGLFHGELTVLTDKGVFIDGKSKTQSVIAVSHIQNNGVTTYVLDGKVHHKKEQYKVSDDVSTIYALDINRESNILVGHWDGTAELLINGVKRLLKKAELAVHSLLIKKIGQHVLYLIGDAEGHVSILNGDETLDYNIGDSPVTLLDYIGSSVLAYNAENVILFEFDNKGNLLNRGYLNIGVPETLSLNNKKQKLIAFDDGCFKEIKISNKLEILKNETSLPKLVRKSVKFKNYLHLSLFVTTTTKFNKLLGREVWSSELQVIDNNSFKIKSVYKFEAGIEITDVVNTEYHKELIDTYEEEKISVGMENVLSQCFVVSCVYGSQDDYGPPLMLFSIDEFGKLTYQCSSPKMKVAFQSLTNHANRLIIGAGDSVVAYKIEYSVADSKFSLKRISDVYRTRYFTSHIKSAGPDVIVGDVIQGITRLELKVKKDISEEDTIFVFKESLKTLEIVHFLTALETYGNLAITADSLKNVKIHLITEDASVVVSHFNIGHQINSIRHISDKSLNPEKIFQIFNQENPNEIEDIIPLFVLGSVDGGIYLLSLVTAGDLSNILENSLEDIVKQTHHVVSKTQTQDAKLESFINFRKSRGIKKIHDTPAFGFLDGDLLKTYDTSVSGKLVSKHCTLL